MELYGVLLDTMSIQRYIFATNRLKENLGASYLVDDIYKSGLKETIKELFPDLPDSILDEWRSRPEQMPIIKDNALFEVGYIGGGNAFLLFKEQRAAEEFVKRWTTRLLVNFPGIIPATAIEKIELNNASDTKAKDVMAKLFKTLAINKNRYIPQTVIPRHGVTAECAHTGYSMEVWCEKLPEQEKRYLSSVSNAKIRAAEEAKKEMIFLLKDIGLSERYTFTDEIEKLGQQTGEDSHIAIVHIDGNDMGERFKSLQTLSEKRRLSDSLQRATKDSLKELIKRIDDEFASIKGEFKILEDEGKEVLPIRPIIIGGDDITFVTDGRLGIYLAKIFLEVFEKKTVSDSKSISACAGVAITKTKYPFYRGYELSEDLLRNAKDMRKKKESKHSWLDFYILKGSISGKIDYLRKKDLEFSERRLYMRPYSLEDLKELLRSASKFKEKKDGKPIFARSRLMELREVLFMDKSRQDAFITELKGRNLSLPEFKGFKEELFLNNETPYLDMIEILEFYPEYAFNKEA